ncbi:hypothetical protein [Streptomyces exfoliatus]|uniref:DinB/UmuC family translesion DNA polymerase n=1 Tax=Streptomyces exfoliatus TaxID=1905 RepID=UPI003C2BADA1
MAASLGVADGRQAHDRAHDINDRPIVPASAARSRSLSYRFDHDELDPDRYHRAVLGLTEHMGAALRDDRQVTQGLTRTVAYVDRVPTARTRSLAAATAHTPALATTARELLISLGLQRARVRSLSLRAERLQAAETAIPRRRRRPGPGP